MIINLLFLQENNINLKVNKKKESNKKKINLEIKTETNFKKENIN